MKDELPCIPGYDVQAEIGRGGMAVVYRVRRRSDGAVLALKMILNGRGASFAQLARFRVEAEALSCLDHPNIVKIRDVGVHQGWPYIALDFAERGSLRQSVSAGPRPTPRRAAELVRTAALAVQHAHERGMLHRDLKPANLLLTADGTLLVSDFGLVKFAAPVREVGAVLGTARYVSHLDEGLIRHARELAAQYRPVPDEPAGDEDQVTSSVWDQCAARTGLLGDGASLSAVRRFLSEARRPAPEAMPDLDGLTRGGAVMGTRSYMAPEQALGDLARIGPRTDVYGLGGILYELLTGRPPGGPAAVFELSRGRLGPPTPPRALAPELSGDIEAVCLKCLEASPECRYESAAALAEDLSRVLDGYAPRAAAAPPGGANAGTAAGPGGLPSTAIQEPGLPPPPPPSKRRWWPFGGSRS